MKKLTKRALAGFIAMLMVVLMMPVMAFADDDYEAVILKTGQNPVYYESLVTACDAAESIEGCTVKILKDINVVVYSGTSNNAKYCIDGGTFSIDGNGKTITASSPDTQYGGYIFNVRGNVTFKNLKLRIGTTSDSKKEIKGGVNVPKNVTVVFEDCDFIVIDPNNNWGTAAIVAGNESTVIVKSGNYAGGKANGTDWQGINIGANSSFTFIDGITNGIKADDAAAKFDIQGGSHKVMGFSAKEGNTCKGITGGYYSVDVTDFCAKGYECVSDKTVDGCSYKVQPLKIAQIGDKTYPTVEAAVKAAEDGDTVALLADVAQDNSVVIDKDIILDLNGKKITVDSGWKGESPTRQALFYVKSGGKFTVNDSVGDGAIDGTSTNENLLGAIIVTIKGQNDDAKNAVLVVNNGLIKGNNYGISTNGDRHNTDITINGGTIIGASDDSTSMYHPDTGKLTITGGKFVGYDGLDIKGGTLVVISGGEFIATGAKVVPEGPKSSGSNSVGSALYVEGNYGYGASVNISGGKFKTTDPAAPAILSMFNESKEATIVIKGGYFSSDVSAYVMDVYSVIKNDGSEVSKVDYPYTIGHKVTFNGNGGTPATKTIEVKHNGKVSKDDVKIPTLDKNTFAGWVDEDGNVFSFDKKIAGNRTIKANWLPDDADGKVTVKDTETGVKAETSIKKSDIPLTVEEVEAIKEGKVLDVNLVVKVEEAKAVDKEEVKLIEKTMDDKQKLGMYLDCSLFKTLDGESVGEIHETLNPITITLTVPDNLRLDGRVYSIVRVHNDEAETLFEGKADKDWKISFKTDKFSTYALLYEGGNPDTGDHNNVALFACLGGLALLGIIVLAGVMLKRKSYK